MASWRCPYCGTPQAESARCWVCQRSTTTCATCRHFRRGIATGLALCGLNPRKVTLRGNEIRACWVGAPSSRYPDAPSGVGRRTPLAATPPDATARQARTFVPVEDLVAVLETRPAPAAPVDPLPDQGTWSFWGDAEG